MPLPESVVLAIISVRTVLSGNGSRPVVTAERFACSRERDDERYCEDTASGWATYGAVMGVSVDALRVEVEGDIDLQGMLALPQPGEVPPGFQSIRVRYFVKSGALREQLEQLAKMAEDLSPTRHSLRAVAFSSHLEIER